jgi:hypothetical protein
MIVPYTDIADPKASEQTAAQVIALVKDYLDWHQTERQSCSTTHKSIVGLFLVIARYQYRHATANTKARGYQDVPTVMALRALQQQYESYPRTTSRRAKPAYALTIEELPVQLRQAMDDWYEFLTDVSWPSSRVNICGQ